jgi:tetratricopeptide (TPR) repeat protein
LLKSGDAKQGREAIDLAHALPLGDETQRSTLEETFRKHGLDDDARRERELILKTGSFLSWDVCNANRLCGDDANTHGDYITAANYWEKAFLGNLQNSTSFLEPWANVMIPVMIHRTRALGLIKQNPANALIEAKIAMTDSPGDANTLIDLVNGFEQSGHKQEADALFAPMATTYTSLCEEFPNSGSAHNQLAWAEARCHRNLDDALKHGTRAVELDPKNTANIDTLAEVYYERGEFDRAIAEMQKCAELEPNVPRHREQIERFIAALAGKK